MGIKTAVRDYFMSGPNNTLNLGKVAGAAGLAGLVAGAVNPDGKIGQFIGAGGAERGPIGYTGGIPEFGINRTLAPNAFSTTLPTGEPRRPGSAGRRYFTDTTFTPTGETMAAERLSPVNAPVRTITPVAPETQEQRIAKAQGIINSLPPEVVNQLLSSLFSGMGISSSGDEEGTVVERAQGGIIPAPQSRGYYLGGTTDGMADQIPATINGTQQAALSDGEFVVPADVVSHLGNGNSDAGAKQLYSMMDRVRQARTGRQEQGRKIAPNKFIPV
jgi:hypothetical protein